MSELALQLIAKEKIEQTGNLNLGNCGLTELPEELFELEWLEELSLCNSYYDVEEKKRIESVNQGASNYLMGTLSPKISNLKNLKRLRLNGDELKGWQLKDVSSIKDLTNIESLYLNNNKIEDISFLKDLTNIESLYLNNNRINDFSFLKDLINIESLYLNNNKIDDFSFLENLKKIQNLNLSNNSIEDISFLQNLTSIESLYLYNNNIDDVSFLQNLTKIESLYLYNNNVEDASFLKDLTTLQILNLSNNNIEDISFSQGLTSVQSLNFQNNRIEDVSFLQNLTTLHTLNLSNNNIEKVSFLKDLINIQTLNLSNNNVKDVSFLKNLTAVQALYLYNNKIEDASFVENLIVIESLYLNNNNNIEDFSFLKNLTTLQTLNLQTNNIKDVSFLENLTAIESLYLNNNNNIEDFSFLKNLTAIQTLNLNKNNIEDISFLENLTTLQTLNLQNNNIEDISFLKNLTTLQTLNLQDNNIEDFSFLKNLSTIQTLNLNNNKVEDISFLKNLRTLQTLNLQNNNIWNASFLKNLINVQALNLSKNNIEDISFLEDLDNIEFLYLQNNDIDDISSLRNLRTLQTLNLSKNNIDDISFLEDLTTLHTLNLSNNKVEDVSCLENLMNVQTLHFQNNNIENISSLLLLIKKGIEVNIESQEKKRNINLFNNPISIPPIEIVKQGNKAIISYYKQLKEQDEDYLFEAKMLIIGEPGAGKTSMAWKIENADCELPQEKDTTKGIDVRQYYFPLSESQLSVLKSRKKITNKNFRLNLWDFGGQEIYKATHRFFLSERSIYVLVADSRNEDTDFNYWLHIVEMFGGDSPFLIVLNEKHQRKKNIDIAEMRKRFDNISEVITVDFADDDHTRLQQLKNTIEFYISKLPLFGSPIPSNWTLVREVIEADTRNTMTLQDYFNTCKKHGINNIEDVRILSTYFHDIGVFLHFQEDALLNKTIFLKPNWATNAVYKVLDHDLLNQKNGRFTKEEAQTIWEEEEYEFIRDELLRLMQKFFLTYQIENTAQYIVPERLPESKPQYGWEKKKNLHLQFDYEVFMPKGILSQFTVEMHRYITNHHQVWYRGVVLERESTLAEIVETYDARQIKIKVVGKNKRDFLTIVAEQIDKINSQYEKMGVERMIPCNCSECKESDKPYFYKYKNLKRRLEKGRTEVECEISYEDVSVRLLIDEVLNEKLMFNRYREDEKMPLSDLDPIGNVNIFLASSKELKDDRDQIEIWVRRQNDRLQKEGKYLKLTVWEDFLDSMSPIRLQDEYNKAVANSDVFISLFGTSVGKYTKEEFNIAYKNFKKTGKPKFIYTYFKEVQFGASLKDLKNLTDLVKFKDKVNKLGHFYTNYMNTEDLLRQLRNQLDKIFEALE